MELTPEERRRIYEEEKARIEAEEKPSGSWREKPGASTVGLEPRVTGLLCYLGAWVTGIIFLVIEQKNQWIRFHAAQSIVVFASLFILGLIFRWIPFIGGPISAVIGLGGFILWIFLMVKAYNGERFKLAIAGDLAEAMAASPAFKPKDDNEAAGGTPEKNEPSPAPAVEPEREPTPPGSTTRHSLEEQIEQKVKEQLKKQGAGSAVGPAFAIAWSIVLLIFFNFFNQYVAYYSSSTPNDVMTWSRYPLLTGDFSQWLPVANAALIAAIIGNIIIIVFNRRLLSSIISFIIDCFAIVAVISLLVIYPFDFSILPNDTAVTATNVSVTIALIAISIGFAVSLIARLVKSIVFAGRHSG